MATPVTHDINHNLHKHFHSAPACMAPRACTTSRLVVKLIDLLILELLHVSMTSRPSSSAAPAPKRLRLRSKTPPPQPTQRTVVGELLGEEADEKRGHHSYNIQPAR